MITVECLKSCPWGIHHAWGPTFQIEPGMVLGAEYPDNTNAKDWEDFKYKLLEAGHAKQIPNAKPAEVKEPAAGSGDQGQGTEGDNTGDNPAGSTEGDNPENPENTGTSGDATGGTGQDSTGGNPDEGGAVVDFKALSKDELKPILEGIALKEMDGPMGSDRKAKDALEAISKEHYGLDVDKRKSVDNIIEDIIAAADKGENGQG